MAQSLMFTEACKYSNVNFFLFKTVPFQGQSFHPKQDGGLQGAKAREKTVYREIKKRIKP